MSLPKYRRFAMLQVATVFQQRDIPHVGLNARLTKKSTRTTSYLRRGERPQTPEDGMNEETERDRIRRSQRAWATQRGLAVDALGYVASYSANLQAEMSTATHEAFTNGAGAELLDSVTGSQAKMRALHSSSALVVNGFDYWTSRDASLLLRALGIGGTLQSLQLEVPLRTGAGGIPPHLDVLLRLTDGTLIGVESKFTEWMAKKSKQAAKLSPYFREDHSTSFWLRAGLTESHQLAKSMLNEDAVFEVLDVPQLLKHMLGLCTAADGKPWTLLYLFYAGSGDMAVAHEREIARFHAAVGDEVRFMSMTYQALFAALSEIVDAQHDTYLSYLRERYFA